jgi:hypothetical protein
MKVPVDAADLRSSPKPLDFDYDAWEADQPDLETVDEEEAMVQVLEWGLRRPLDEDDRLWARLIVENSLDDRGVAYVHTPIVEEFLARASAGDPIVSPHYLRSWINLSDEDLETQLNAYLPARGSRQREF